MNQLYNLDFEDQHGKEKMSVLKTVTGQDYHQNHLNIFVPDVLDEDLDNENSDEDKNSTRFSVEYYFKNSLISQVDVANIPVGESHEYSFSTDSLLPDDLNNVKMIFQRERKSITVKDKFYKNK